MERNTVKSVFEDLGFSPERAENLRVRSELVRLILQRIAADKLIQTEAATLFGVTQPRISALVRGKIHQFSIDALVSMLAHAGIPLSISVDLDHRAHDVDFRLEATTPAPPSLHARVTAPFVAWAESRGESAGASASLSGSTGPIQSQYALAA